MEGDSQSAAEIDMDLKHYVRRADEAEKEIEDLTKTIKKTFG